MVFVYSIAYLSSDGRSWNGEGQAARPGSSHLRRTTLALLPNRAQSVIAHASLAPDNWRILCIACAEMQYQVPKCRKPAQTFDKAATSGATRCPQSARHFADDGLHI